MKKTGTKAQTVTWNGNTYKVRGSIEVPDFTAMARIDVALWLVRHTYARGYSRPNPLAGFAGALKVVAR